MTPLLLTLRQQAPKIIPSQFLARQPGCWVQYYDDTPAKDTAKALSASAFVIPVARYKQRQMCAVCFSLQAFGQSRTKDSLLVFRNLGVDVDLLSAQERRTLSPAEIDRRKEEWLSQRLRPFPLVPHWLIETRHGFHVIFRVMPQRDAAAVLEGLAISRRLVSALQGDANAVLLTQVLRVPGTLQFKIPGRPFLCRLLLDRSDTIAPYELAAVRTALGTWERSRAGSGTRARQATAGTVEEGQTQRWERGLEGVPEGERNMTAAAIVGAILGRLPEPLWETAGWGGLKEWNRRNTVPLSERELRTVYESIARREAGKTGTAARRNTRPAAQTRPSTAPSPAC